MARRLHTGAVAGLLLVITLTFSTVFGGPFSAPNDGFSLQLPPGWIQIPSTVIAEVQQDLARRAPNAPKMQYDYAFQLGSPNQWFTYPYVLVQVKRSGRVPETEFAKIDQFPWSDSAARFQERAREIVSEFEIGKPRFDPASRVIRLNMGSNVANVGRISGLSALVPTEYGFIHLLIFT